MQKEILRPPVIPNVNSVSQRCCHQDGGKTYQHVLLQTGVDCNTVDYQYIVALYKEYFFAAIKTLSEFKKTVK